MANKQYLAWVDRRAQELRKLLYIKPADVLDPFALAKVMGVPIIYPSAKYCLPDDVLTQSLTVDSSSWSAGTLCLPGNRKIIVLNPSHADTRNRATVMEELAHIHLNHRPSKIINSNEGLAFRSFDKKNEQEAYWVGAAALVTTYHLNHAKNRNLGQLVLANLCQVSIALVRFRENVTGIRLE